METQDVRTRAYNCKTLSFPEDPERFTIGFLSATVPDVTSIHTTDSSAVPFYARPDGPPVAMVAAGTRVDRVEDDDGAPVTEAQWSKISVRDARGTATGWVDGSSLVTAQPRGEFGFESGALGGVSEDQRIGRGTWTCEGAADVVVVRGGADVRVGTTVPGARFPGYQDPDGMLRVTTVATSTDDAGPIVRVLPDNSCRELSHEELLAPDDG